MAGVAMVTALLVFSVAAAGLITAGTFQRTTWQIVVGSLLLGLVSIPAAVFVDLECAFQPGCESFVRDLGLGPMAFFACPISILAAVAARVDKSETGKSWAWIAAVSAWFVVMAVVYGVVRELVDVAL